MSDLASQIVIGADVEGVVTGTARAAKSLKDLGRAAGAAGQEAATGTKVVGDAAEQTTQKVDRATKNAIASFERAIASQKAAGKGQAEFLAQLATDRGANTKRLAPYIAELQELTAKNKAAQDALRSSEAAMGGLGMSAKATTAALRQVPAQLTDIVVSLQGGQAPMTVLLQQGGQLKDVFGGIGPAAKAMGGYILGLVNPFTLAAAAVAGLTYAYYVGSKELDGYRNALILSGNAAGTTAAQMQLYAASISKTVGTQHEAAAAIAEMAATGRVAGTNLEYFGAVALKMEKTVGQAVSKTAEQFAELARNPVSASEKLNETTNYLTASLYAQIKALEAQGKAQEAGALAQKAFADALNSRMGEIKDNMGWIESGWKAITNVIKGAGDAALKVGRAPDTQGAAQNRVDTAQRKVDSANAAPSWWEGAADLAARKEAGKLAEKELATAREVVELQKQDTESKGKAAKLQAEQVQNFAATKTWLDIVKKDETDIQKIQEERVRLANAYGAATRAAGGDSAKQLELAKQFETAYSKIGEKQTNLDLSGQVEAIKQAERMKQEAYKQTAEVLQTELKIGMITERDYIVARGQLAVEGLTAQKTAVQAELSITSKKKDSQKEVATLAGQIALIEKQIGTEKIKTELSLLALAVKRIDAINAVRIAEAEELKVAQAASEKLYGERWNASLQSANEFLRTQKESNEQTAFEATLLGKTTEQRTVLIAQYRAEVELKKQLLGIDGELQAAERDVLAKKYEESAALAKSNAATQAATQETQRIIDSIDSTAHSVWTNVMQGGQDAFTKIGQTIKASILDLLYQLTIKKWVISIAASVTGSVATAQNAPGGGNPISSIASIFKGSGSSWMTDFGGSLSNSVSDFGTAMVDKGFTKFGTSLEGFGLDLQSVSGTINQFGDGLGYLNAAMAASKGQWGNAIGSAVGTYFGGPIGAAIGSKIGSWVDNLTGNTGTKPSIEGGFASAGTQGSANGKNYVNGVYGGAIDAAAKTIVTDITSTYTSIVKSLGGTAGNLTAQSFVGLDGNGGSKGSQNALSLDAQLNGNYIYNRYTEQGGNINAGMTTEEMSAAVKLSSEQILVKALQATDLGPALNDYLDTIVTAGMSLAELDATLADVTGFAAFRDAVRSLPFPYLVNASVAAEKAILSAAGGLDAFKSSVGTYIDLFYSDSEKTAIKTKSLSAAFADVGVTMPALGSGTREWYKALIDSLGAQDLTIEANAKAYASALALAGAVNELAPAAATAAAAIQRSASDIAKEAAGLQTQLWTLQGDTASLRAAELATLDPSNQALQKRIWALEDETAAANAAAAASAKIANERASLQTQLMQAQGDTAGLRAQTLEGLDASNRAIQQQIWALEDQAKATAAATAAANEATQAAQAKAAAEKQALADAVSAAKGVFDRAVNAERTRINTLLNDKQAALTAVQSVFDLLKTSTKDLYAQVASTVAMTAAQGNAYISTALALAKAGGVVPDQSALTDAITAARAGIDGTQYASQFEADRARLILAGQLSQLKDVAGDQLSTADRALNLAKDQLTALDKVVAGVQDMIDAANGVDTRIRSVSDAVTLLSDAINAQAAGAQQQALNAAITSMADAVKNLQTALAAIYSEFIAKTATETITKPTPSVPTGSPVSYGSGASFGGGSGSAAAQAAAPYNYSAGIGLGGSVNTPVADAGDFITSLDWGNPAAVEKSVATAANFAQQNGLSQADIARELGLSLDTVQASMDSRGIPRFAVGTNYVPKDMLAQIHEGEAIIPKAFNPWSTPGGYDNSKELITAVRALDARLANIESHTMSTADSTSKVANAHDGQSMTPLRVQVV